MPPRRQRPLPKLDISLEDLPPPEANRARRLFLSFTDGELAMVEKAARERGEQRAVCRTIILTAFQNSAAKALARKPDLLLRSPAEQQRDILEAFTLEP